MNPLPRALVDRVRAAADIVVVIGATVPLTVPQVPPRPKWWPGAHLGVCPFCSGILAVTPKVFHCFDCGESGDVFAFVMQTRGLTLRQAVQELAAPLGIDVESTAGSA